MTKEKITVQIGDEVIELKGAELEAFNLDREQAQEHSRLIEAEQMAKAEAKQSALAKLKAIGLTEEEIATLRI